MVRRLGGEPWVIFVKWKNYQPLQFGRVYVYFGFIIDIRQLSSNLLWRR